MDDTIVIVCGGRYYDDHARVEHVLNKLKGTAHRLVIVHGACGISRGVSFYNSEVKGADGLAHRWAMNERIDSKLLADFPELEPWISVVPFPAEWERLGSAAGPTRNAEMVKFVLEHEFERKGVIAFPGRRGTADLVSKAEAAGLKVMKIK